MTKKMTRVTAVHTMRCWKGTLVSGTWTSGMRGVNGLTKSRKRTVWMDCQRLSLIAHSTEPLVCFVSLVVLRVMIRTAAHDCWMRAPCAPVTPGGDLKRCVASSRAALGVEGKVGGRRKGALLSVVVRKRVVANLNLGLGTLDKPGVLEAQSSHLKGQLWRAPSPLYGLGRGLD